MYKKTVRVVLVAVLVLHCVVDAKRSKKNKRTKPEAEDTTPEPSLVTYSTFGFNDVGGYDGFVPSSPDYATFLSNFNHDSSTRLYGPAFPTALESTGFGDNYGSQTSNGKDFSTGEGGGPQPLEFQKNAFNFFNNPTFDSVNNQNQNTAHDVFAQTSEDDNSPVYGTKLNSKSKGKFYSQFNNSDYNVFNSGFSNLNNVKYSSFNEAKPSFENKPSNFEESGNFNQYSFNYAPSYSSSGSDDSIKSESGSGSMKFPKVIDFTKMKQYYPTAVDMKFPSTTVSPGKEFNSMSTNIQNEVTHANKNENSNKLRSSAPREPLEFKDAEDVGNSESSKPNFFGTDFGHGYFVQSHDDKNFPKRTKSNLEQKEKNKSKSKPWSSINYGNDFKNWNNPVKGYDFSSNFSNMTVKYDFGSHKKPFNNSVDEILPASSNVIDLTHYEFPETDYSSFKKIPGIKAHYDEDDDDYNHVKSSKQKPKHNPDDFFSQFEKPDDYLNQFKKPDDYLHQHKKTEDYLNQFKKPEDYFNQFKKPDEYLNQFKNFYSTTPTTTSNWGNVFKSSEYSLFKNHAKKPPINDDYSDDIVHIPKRHKYGKYFDNKPNEWSSYSNYRPSKKPASDWSKEVSNTRFKSEEELLGLRTHDTSHPSYLPTFKQSHNAIHDETDYKKLVEKWRQSYIKSKYQDTASRDYEHYASDSKPVPVPVPKPYPIEVPHPIIVPVPQPLPIRVPIPKPVAIPVIRELTVPIEKPVPYPVIKKVPYPIEKLVPVPVEKQVPVPVIKPYPVAVPHIRPVFHHTKPYDSDGDDDEYMPRPESSKRVPYSKKRPRSSYNRSRRPSRTTYHDRNRRRWPSSRPIGVTRDQRRPQKYDFDFEEYSPDRRSHISYCERTGRC